MHIIAITLGFVILSCVMFYISAWIVDRVDYVFGWFCDVVVFMFTFILAMASALAAVLYPLLYVITHFAR